MAQLLQPLLQAQQLVGNLEEGQEGRQRNSLGERELRATTTQYSAHFTSHMLQAGAVTAVTHLIDMQEVFYSVSTLFLCVLEAQFADKVTDLLAAPALYIRRGDWPL